MLYQPTEHFGAVSVSSVHPAGRRNGHKVVTEVDERVHMAPVVEMVGLAIRTALGESDNTHDTTGNVTNLPVIQKICFYWHLNEML